jgi:hypothetical protein
VYIAQYGSIDNESFSAQGSLPTAGRASIPVSIAELALMTFADRIAFERRRGIALSVPL